MHTVRNPRKEHSIAAPFQMKIFWLVTSRIVRVWLGGYRLLAITNLPSSRPQVHCTFEDFHNAELVSFEVSICLFWNNYYLLFAQSNLTYFLFISTFTCLIDRLHYCLVQWWHLVKPDQVWGLYLRWKKVHRSKQPVVCKVHINTFCLIEMPLFQLLGMKGAYLFMTMFLNVTLLIHMILLGSSRSLSGCRLYCMFQTLGTGWRIRWAWQPLEYKEDLRWRRHSNWIFDATVHA